MPQMSRQGELAGKGQGEARSLPSSAETPKAGSGPGRSGTESLMEAVVERGNLLAALKRVRQNKGSPGVDGMTAFGSAVAGFGLLLRERLYRGDLGYDRILSMARGAKSLEVNGDRAEFVHLIGIAKLLGESQAFGMP